MRLGASVQSQGPERLVFSGPGRGRARLVVPSSARPPGRAPAPRAEVFVLLARHGLPEESAPAFRRLVAWGRRRLEAGAAGVVARFVGGDVLAFRPTGLDLRPAPLAEAGAGGDAATGRWLGALVLALGSQESLPEALERASRLAARPGAEALRRAAVRCAGPVPEAARA